MRRRKESYEQAISHQRCREAFGKMVSDGVVLKQIERAESLSDLRRVMKRIHPTFVAGARSRGVGSRVFSSCPLSKHLERMSRSKYRTRDFALVSWKEVCNSRWA